MYIQVEPKDLNKDIILIFLLCTELGLNFRSLKKLYSCHNDIFWKYVYNLFPAFRIKTNRLYKLTKSASLIFSKIKGDDVVLSDTELTMYSNFKILLKDKYVNKGNLYEHSDFYTLTDCVIDIILYDGTYISNIKHKDLDYYKNHIVQIKVNKELYVRTSEYEERVKQNYGEYSTKEDMGFLDIIENKYSIVKKCFYEISCNEDILRLAKNGKIEIEGDLHIYHNVDIDLDIACRNIITFNESSLKAGNVDAVNIRLNNLNVGNLSAVNIDAQDIVCNNLKANNIKADNISYYAVCYANKNIICSSIKGRRPNSKHFVLDGEFRIHGQ